MNRSLILLAVASLLTAPTTAQRGGFRRGNSQDVFKFLSGKYDKDQDGKITSAEYPRGAEKFAAYDANGDGVLTADDFSGGGRRRGRRSGGGRGGGGRNRNAGSDLPLELGGVLARSADADEDGKVTQAEWKKVIAAVDGNKDGNVDTDELGGILCAALGRKNLSPRAVGRRSRHLDTNKDGRIQLSEIDGLFARLDKDQDQTIGKDELGTARRPRPSGPPRVGDMAPDFDLPTVADPEQTVKLSSFRGAKPVALIFGSYT